MKTALLLPLLLLLSSCATPQPGSDTAEIRAEQVLAVSVAALDGFLAFEFNNQASLPPAVRDIASKVRREAPKAIASANRARLAYKGARDAGSEATLLTALSVVDALVGEIRVWLPQTTAGKAGAGNPVPNISYLIAEADASRVVRTGSWVALLPVFVELSKQIYLLVNSVRDTARQAVEWTLEQETAFAAKVAVLKDLPHWKIL